jgi:hypothetical protein
MGVEAEGEPAREASAPGVSSTREPSSELDDSDDEMGERPPNDGDGDGGTLDILKRAG